MKTISIYFVTDRLHQNVWLPKNTHFFQFWCSVCYIISYASWNFDWLCDPQSKCFLNVCIYIDNKRPSCVLKESWRYCSSDSMPIFSVSCPQKFGNLDRHEKSIFAQLLKQFVQNAWTKKIEE